MERRRGAELEAELLAAAWAELQETGYARLTMEGVAARAKTGKQVLYRRWKNRAELILAAKRHTAGSIVDDVPDTGQLRGDVLAVLDRMVTAFEDLGPEVVHGLLAEAPDLDPELFTVMPGIMTELVTRAAARGEIPSAAVPPRVLTVPANLLRHEMLLTRTAISPDVLTEITDDVFLPLLGAKTTGG